MKPLFSRAVRTVAWNAVRGCGCRCRATRRVTPKKSPGRKWTWTSSPQSVGGPRTGETGGGAAVRGAKPSWPSPAYEPPVRRGPAPAGSRLVTGPGSVMNAMSWMSPPHSRRAKGNSSPTRAISFAQAIRVVSWERRFSVDSQSPSAAYLPTACPPDAESRRPCPLASATPQQADRGDPLAGQSC